MPARCHIEFRYVELLMPRDVYFFDIRYFCYEAKMPCHMLVRHAGYYCRHNTDHQRSSYIVTPTLFAFRYMARHAVPSPCYCHDARYAALPLRLMRDAAAMRWRYLQDAMLMHAASDAGDAQDIIIDFSKRLISRCCITLPCSIRAALCAMPYV